MKLIINTSYLATIKITTQDRFVRLWKSKFPRGNLRTEVRMIHSFIIKRMCLDLKKPTFLQDTSSCPWQGGAEFPGSASPITRAKIITASRLTRDDAVKTGYCLTLDTGVCKCLWLT